MFDLINGIPVHPLVVHAIVVLLPLALLGTIAIAVKPAWRRPYGPLVVAAVAVSAVLAPVATSSGEQLEQRVGDPGKHAELGDQLIWFILPLLALTVALVWVDRRATKTAAPAEDASTSRPPARSSRRCSPPSPSSRPWPARCRSTGWATPVPRPPGATPPPAANDRRRAVLTVGVCEDDPGIRRVLTQALGLAGHEVLTAHTGAEALRTFGADSAVDVILMDIGLPDSDGRDVCQALRSAGQHAPVLFLTALDAPHETLSGFSAGGDDFVSKPFEVKELIARVEALGRRGRHPARPGPHRTGARPDRPRGPDRDRRGAADPHRVPDARRDHLPSR